MTDQDEADLIRRTADGRPFIIPPTGGRARAYTRCSTFARALDDGAGLMNWKQRILLNGMLHRDFPIPADLDPMDYRGPAGALIEELMFLGGGNDAAIFGTACHALSEMVDFTNRGLVGDHNPPAEMLAWLDRYVEATRDLQMVEGEVFVVNDHFTAAGTLDRLVRLPDGRVVVADTKTGATLHPVQFAIQLALYATAERYDPATGARSPIHPDLDPDLGVVIHVPAARGGVAADPGLIPIDLTTGWALAELALTVRRSRTTDVSVDPAAWRIAMTPKREEVLA